MQRKSDHSFSLAFLSRVFEWRGRPFAVWGLIKKVEAVIRGAVLFLRRSCYVAPAGLELAEDVRQDSSSATLSCWNPCLSCQPDVELSLRL